MNGNSQTVARFVTVTMGLVIGLTFLFGFGNVLNLALKLQVPAFVAPLVAPAVDLTVLGLLVGTRHLAVSGASDDVLRPARRLLVGASVLPAGVSMALDSGGERGCRATFAAPEAVVGAVGRADLKGRRRAERTAAIPATGNVFAQRDVAGDHGQGVAAVGRVRGCRGGGHRGHRSGADRQRVVMWTRWRAAERGARRVHAGRNPVSSRYGRTSSRRSSRVLAELSVPSARPRPW